MRLQISCSVLLLLPLTEGVYVPARPLTLPVAPCPCCQCRFAAIVDEWSNMKESEPTGASAIAVQFLRWYKRTISPLLPPGCRFIPTCSEYGQQCFQQFTIPQASVLIVWRLIRCNPLHWPGTGFGVDEPVWPPCAYWAGDGRLRTWVDDERSRRKAAGEDDDSPVWDEDPLGLAERSSSMGDEASK